MTKTRRVLSIVFSGIMMILAVVMAIVGETGYGLVVILLGAMAFLAGLRRLLYYFTMAIHMVGGMRSLFMGILLLDFGVLTMMMSRVPTVYVMIYLLAGFMFTGVRDLLGAIGSKNARAPWVMMASLGIVEILAGAACFFFLGNATAVVYVYAITLMYSAVIRLINALRSTAIVYVG